MIIRQNHLGDQLFLLYPNLSRDEVSVLRDNLLNICSAMGVLFTYNHPAVKRIAKCLKKSNNITLIAPATAYVKCTDDQYGIWNSFVNMLGRMKKEIEDDDPNTRLIESSLRAISNICFITPKWIFELYHGPCGKETVLLIKSLIILIIHKRKWLSVNDYNAKIIRDILELLLCICILKKEDPNILDCNSKGTKALVKKLKLIDNDMRILKGEGKLGQDFNSRFRQVSKPSEYYKVNDVIYCLVRTLTGGDSVSLIGFNDNN